MWSDDNVLSYNVSELISDGVGGVFIRTTFTNPITLIKSFSAGKLIKAKVKNLCHFSSVERINLFVGMCDLNLYFVEYTFGADAKLTIRRILTPTYGRSTINLYTQGARIHEPIKNI
jgi:hypothetical protein